MEILIKGTSVKLIQQWISTMLNDIKNNKIYCSTKERKLFAVSEINRTRLQIMRDIMPTESDLPTYTDTESMKMDQEALKKYLLDMKTFLES
ncbi:TPA: hypothetical protein DIC40_00640 [Patescibacteria group bacterium]|nr:hypothetical protein P148_SR1C00001G0973 [candidate division SR1 bacterium RAAC1_SR1_1]HCY20385.1 hypothetical protein [Candidatus Gracilibacteria bacterium]